MTKVSTPRRIFQIIAIFFLLVVFPAGSWYYLKVGFDEHKSTIQDMQEFGAFPTMELYREGVPYQMKGDSGVIRLAAFTNKQEPKELLHLYSRLHEQFDLRPDVKLFLVYAGSDTLWRPDTITYSFIKDTSQIHILSATSKTDKFDLEEAFYLPDSLDLYSTVVLSDLSGQVRNFFRYQDEERVKLMVRQIAVLLPKRKFNSPRLKRDKEK